VADGKSFLSNRPVQETDCPTRTGLKHLQTVLVSWTRLARTQKTYGISSSSLSAYVPGSVSKTINKIPVNQAVSFATKSYANHPVASVVGGIAITGLLVGISRFMYSLVKKEAVSTVKSNGITSAWKVTKAALQKEGIAKTIKLDGHLCRVEEVNEGDAPNRIIRRFIRIDDGRHYEYATERVISGFHRTIAGTKYPMSDNKGQLVEYPAPVVG
jgi:hypothetical protein